VQDPRVELAAAMEPALEVGGDLYDFYRLDERRLFFLLGDVSGKGLPASIFMAVSKALCKSTVLRAGVTDVGVVVTQANAEVSRDNPASLFVTAFAAILDLETGELGYCNAGQENPWLLRANGAIERLADGGGPPLCAVDGYDYRAAGATLSCGDMICVVSDGITEASDSRGTLYGTGRVEAALANARSARAAVDAIRTSVKAFAGGAVQADDMTVLALRWTGAASGSTLRLPEHQASLPGHPARK
jgi:serine phosphatase RsbU (regulator of sigma subunit)